MSEAVLKRIAKGEQIAIDKVEDAAQWAVVEVANLRKKVKDLEADYEGCYAMADDIAAELAALRERAGRLEGLLGKVHRLIPAYIAESDYNGIVAGLFKEIHQTIPSPTASPRKCRGCNGEKGWYSPDNGQWVQCSCDSALSTPAPAKEADQ